MRQLEIDATAAVPLCWGAAAWSARSASRSSPTPQTISADYERAWQAYVTSLITAGRSQTDVDTLTRAIARRASLGRPSDQASADAYATLAIVQQRLGASDQAEASFTKSESIYSALIERSPRGIPSLEADSDGARGASSRAR